MPEAVEQAITRALAKVPADRFATVEQFSRALMAAERAPRTDPCAVRSLAGQSG